MCHVQMRPRSWKIARTAPNFFWSLQNYKDYALQLILRGLSNYLRQESIWKMQENAKFAFFSVFEYGSRFMRLLKHVESGQNDIFLLQLIKLHYFDKFWFIWITHSDFRGLWILKNVQKWSILRILDLESLMLWPK